MATTSISSNQPYNGNQAASAEEQRSKHQADAPALKEQSLGVSLPPGWIVEWSGQKGRQILHAAVLTSTCLTNDPVGLIIQYLRKNDIFGLEDLEHAAGGRDGLTSLIGEYNPEKPLPVDIDDEMQAPLTQYFDAETLQSFHEYRASKGMPRMSKMTELYSLYWRPARVTANVIENDIAKDHGMTWNRSPAPFSVLGNHGETRTPVDNWILFPNDVFGRNKTVPEQEALVPVGFEFPHFTDAVFCIVMKYICTGTMIMPNKPSTSTNCQENHPAVRGLVDNKVCIGEVGNDQRRPDDEQIYLTINFSIAEESVGVAILRKFS